MYLSMTINFVNMHYKTKLHLTFSIQKLRSEHIDHETILGRHYTQSFSHPRVAGKHSTPGYSLFSLSFLVFSFSGSEENLLYLSPPGIFGGAFEVGAE